MGIKNKIKDSIKYYPRFNSEKLKRKIDKYEYISFDIFDTLIQRDVYSPRDVFKLMEIEINNKSFHIDRIKAEQIAREQATSEEILLKDIYEVMNKKLGYKNIDKLMQLEKEIEKGLCTKRNDIFNIYKYCIEKNKKIIIISNMYLSSEYIADILDSNGYKKYEKLYVSSTIGRKKDKTLFKYVLEDLNISSKQLLHIGDSYKNDYRGANKYHIKSYLIPRKIKKLLHCEKNYVDTHDTLFMKSLDSFIENRLDIDNDCYFNFGYESFGLLLYEFNVNMHKELEKKEINDIFFFSRDGYIIKKVYDEIYPNDKIKSHYIYVSRRSLRVPQIWTNPELSHVLNTFPLAKMLTMDTFIKNLGLEPKKYINTLKKYNLMLETSIEKKEILNNEAVVMFYEEIKSDVIKHSKEECNLLFDYFKQEGFKGKTAVVDIGWHGSLQYFIQVLVEKSKYDLEMDGYYIGLAKEARKEINATGFIKDLNSKTGSCDSWKAFNGLAETLFLAQEGSTEKFTKEGKRIIPVLYPYEYSDKYGKNEIEAIKVKSIQDGAIKFVHDFKNSPLSKINISSSTAFRKIMLTGLYPNKKDLKMFSDFRFLEEQIEYLAMPKSIIFYLAHPKLLKKDLFSCRWKIGFLKKLLRIKLPYNKIYSLLRKISG